MARDCNNDIVCRFCKRPGHSERECEARQEFRDRKSYGEYYSDILEGRQTDDSVFDGTKKKNTTTLPTTHKDNKLSRPMPAATSTAEPVNQRTPPPNKETEQLVPINTVILGDSNMLNAQSPSGVVIQALSGATLLSVPTLLGESTKQLDNSHLQHVVIHLGTNDIKKYDGGEIMINATSAVEKGTERAQKTANDAASNINNYLKALSRMSDEVSFIDNSPLLAPAGRPLYLACTPVLTPVAYN